MRTIMLPGEPCVAHFSGSSVGYIPQEVDYERGTFLTQWNVTFQMEFHDWSFRRPGE